MDQLLEFTLIGKFQGHVLDRIAGKLIQQKFMSTYSVFVKYLVMTHEQEQIISC